jgi:hemerythrin
MAHWTKDLETGFSDLDAQHRRLFETIERITPLLEGPSLDELEVKKLVDFLESYAREHFECEERCMAETNCPVRDVNKDAHQTFLAGVQRFKADYEGHGQKREFVALLQASLRAWLRNHILSIDTGLRDCARR